MRSDLGSLAQRLGSVEKQVAEIQAERSVLLPDYKTFRSKVSAHIEVMDRWMSNAAGERKGIAGTAKVAYALSGSGLMALVALIARHFAA